MTLANTVPLAVFGPGSLYIQRIDIANQTPVNVGYCQEFSYDEAGETKELYGQRQYPLVVARGTIKATGKIKAAVLSGIALNAVFNGGTFSVGQLLMAQQVPELIPTTPFQVTPAIPGGGVFDKDLGVLYADTGLPLQRVASSPTVGQYSVVETTGVYTFAAADQAGDPNVLITFAYTLSTGGQTLTVTNQNIGTTPAFQIDYSTSLYGAPYYVRMFACVSNKLTRAHKLTDFTMPEIDFGFFALANNKVYEVSYPQVS